LPPITLLNPLHILLLFYVTLFFFFYCYGPHRHLHSFPTRRSSDLAAGRIGGPVAQHDLSVLGQPLAHRNPRGDALGDAMAGADRSEEHTSELQSLAYLVCRLLLEKKKKKK